MNKVNGLYAPLIAIAMTGTVWAEETHAVQSTTEAAGRPEDRDSEKPVSPKRSDSVQRHQSSRKFKKREINRTKKMEDPEPIDRGTTTPAPNIFEHNPALDGDDPIV